MINKIKQELKKVIIGQEELIDSLLIALLTNGHLYIEGIPGVAKTTAIKALGKIFNLNLNRVQFTPDLLPSDIIGSEIIDFQTKEFIIKKGPVFTNLLLADEINRASPKVQSALLEAMAENQVTIANKSYEIDSPFIVFATANPIEQDGTFELPEASLDRFMLKVVLNFNKFSDEITIIKKAAENSFENPTQIATKLDLLNLQAKLKDIYIDEVLIEYILKIIEATREPKKYDLEEISPFIEFGVSTRGSINLYKAAKADALLNNYKYVTPSNIAKCAFLVLRHRIILSYQAHAQNISSDDIIRKILAKIPVP
jgi:MoxR-like ATPase